MLVLPPNTQGIAQLQLFEMAGAFDLDAMGAGSAEYLHTLIEMKKLAFADRDQWAADPEFTDIPLDDLLDPAYLARRAAMVTTDAAAEERRPGVQAAAAVAGTSGGGQRLRRYRPPHRGRPLGQRGQLDPESVCGFLARGCSSRKPGSCCTTGARSSIWSRGIRNIIAPGKRPYHTLTPMMALRADGAFAFTLGTPGGDSQPQSLLQIVNNMVHFGMTPQAAIEAPRFRSYGGLRVAVEDRFTSAVLARLGELGHDIEVVHGWTATFGGAQMIFRGPNGTLTAASDPRREAYAIAH